MAPKKPVKLSVKAEKEPVKTLKASVKAAAPAKKVVTNKIEVKRVEKKTEVYQKVQTAEGWKRMMKKEHALKKKI